MIKEHTATQEEHERLCCDQVLQTVLQTAAKDSESTKENKRLIKKLKE